MNPGALHVAVSATMLSRRLQVGPLQRPVVHRFRTRVPVGDLLRLLGGPNETGALVIEDVAWADVEDLLVEVRDWALEDEALPVSMVVTFHDGEVAAILELPPFSLEDADMITDELCRFLPSIYPHQVLFVRPAVYEDLDPSGRLYAMQVLLWERGCAPRHLIVPVPIHDGVDGAPFPVEEPDPWAQRVVDVLDQEPPWPPVIDTRLPDGFDLMVRSGTRLEALLASLHPQP